MYCLRSILRHLQVIYESYLGLSAARALAEEPVCADIACAVQTRAHNVFARHCCLFSAAPAGPALDLPCHLIAATRAQK